MISMKRKERGEEERGTSESAEHGHSSASSAWTQEERGLRKHRHIQRKIYREILKEEKVID